ncbi:heat shock protein 70 family, peptide-binding domain protein [Artemisia annua]|uniref:Heat shock protein 70 family, peptide-binding domain protein n=1 Tax=Artemisia annua TaxID=35608 RepID=A0A2U1MPL4_ARTAN|nr:heat shock protein 70 family, peptide-binding domain protein [Artemisia annua]
MSKRTDGTAIGIDLGTTYSCVAFWSARRNRVEIIPNEQGKRVTPSCVAWSDNKLLVGEAAKNQINSNSRNTVFGSKEFYLVDRLKLLTLLTKKYLTFLVNQRDDTNIRNSGLRSISMSLQVRYSFYRIQFL